MKNRIMVMMILGVMVAGQGWADTDKMPQPKPGSAEFERIKALAGVWKGTSETDGKTEPAEIDYKVTSMGSAVVETLFPGTPHEMVSIYHDNDDGKLSMTHYCGLGNRPELDLKKADNDRLEFELSPLSHLAATQHMHGLNLDLSGGAVKQTWTCFKDGHQDHTTIISVKKV